MVSIQRQSYSNVLNVRKIYRHGYNRKIYKNDQCVVTKLHKWSILNNDITIMVHV